MRFGLLMMIGFAVSTSAGSVIPALGDPMEGDRPSLLDEHKALLDSVLPLSFTTGRCTASLVAKNLLLTARHCAMNEKTDQQNIKPGDTIQLRDFDYEVVDARIQEKETISAKNTDIALFLVKPKGETDPNLLEKLKPIEIAVQARADFINEILMAGYGRIDWFTPHEEDILRVGTNVPTVNYFQDSNHPKSRNEKKINDQMQIGAEEELIVEANREAFWNFTIKPGETLLDQKFRLKMKIEDRKSAMFQAGDSGSPALAHAPNGSYQIVGVATHAQMDMDHRPTTLYAEGPNQVRTRVVTVPYFDRKIGLQDAQAQLGIKALNSELQSAGWMSEQGQAKVKFKLVFQRRIHEVGAYASVLTPLNQVFLSRNIAEMGAIRDLH